MKNSELLRLHIQKRLPALIVTVLLFASFGLYYLGLYDISFIERPESWEGNFEALVSIFRKSSDDPVGDDPAVTDPAVTDPADPPAGENDPDSNDSNDSNSDDVRPPSQGSQAQILKFESVTEMLSKGYRVTDKKWSDDCCFAVLETQFELPSELSYSRKTYDKEVATYYDDGTETTVETVKDHIKRFALEMYMGYILYDDLGKLYLVGSDGQVLCRYDDTEYVPAFTRDTEGRPLFYKTNEYSLKYPTSTAKPDQNGNSQWLTTAELKVSGKKYYYLSQNGQYFVESDYNDVTDNRGLYFDYPAYYGNPDSELKRYCRNTTRIFTSLKGVTSVQHSMRWLFSAQKINLELLNFDINGKNLNDPAGKDLETMFPYTMAYSYNEGYATVRCDIDWDYYHDVKQDDGTTKEEHVEVCSNEVRIVDKYGKIMFDSRKNYYSSLGWTANERFEEPLFKGIASLGSYYYDHGYTRLRIQSYDRYYFTDLDTVFIVSDEDVLVDTSGNRFNIPSGYTLKSYSDGILLLEKDGLYGYLNTAGVWVRKPQMKYAAPFLEGVAVCMNSEGKYGVISTSGKVLIPFDYDHISNISSGTLVAYRKDQGWKIYQKMTNS